MNNARMDAMLLLGPTGSGKTPLGELCEKRGVAQRRCLHFDFGENLRRVVARAHPDDVVTAEDIRFLRTVLTTGALLEDKDFPIAERMLRAFLRAQADGQTLVILNGLPRHVGQALMLEPSVDIRTVVCLKCSAETVFARVEANLGGDRTHRTDDSLAEIERKLDIFAQRTAPLVDHFESAGAELIAVNVGAHTTTLEMWEQLQQADSFSLQDRRSP